jgi:Tol biopolymer transport system component
MSRATSAAPVRPPIGRVAAAAALILICTGSLPVVPSRPGGLWPGSETAVAAVANVQPIAVTVEPKRACVRACAESTRIWTMRTDGSGALPVTAPTNGYDRLPRWSPDGRALAFARTSATTRRAEIFVMRVVGNRFSSPRRVSSTATQWGGLGCEGARMVPVWSPSSTRLAFTCRRGDESTVLVTRADGTGQRRVAPVAGTADDSPAWTRDSAWVSFTRVDTTKPFGAPGRSTIWGVRAGSTLGTPKLVLSKANAVGQGTWARRSGRLAYVERNERTLKTSLRVWNPETGSDRAADAVGGTKTFYGPVWSPDDAWVAVAVGDGLSNSAVKAVPSRSGSSRTLSHSTSLAFAPAWASSTMVVFDAVSGTTTPTQQVVRNSVSKPSPRNLPVTNGYTYDASWRPTLR